MAGPHEATSPVSTSALVLEGVRSALLLCCLAGAVLLFALVQAWVLAAVLALITAGAVHAGAFSRPAQLRAARHPGHLHDVMATPLSRRRQAWLRLDDRAGKVLVAEVRSARTARLLSPGPLPVTVVGPFEDHAWVVLQAGRLTMWPVRRLSAVIPDGARPMEPKRGDDPTMPPRRPF